MSEESLENKKSFIRKEIEEKGYDLKDFVNYLTKEKSQELLDLEKIQFMEIQAYVVQFQAQNQDKRKEIPQQTEQTQQNQQNQQKKKIQRKSSKGSDEEEPEDLWGDFDDLKISNDNYYDDRSSIIKNELSLEEYKEKEKLKTVEKEDRDYNSPFNQKFLNIIGKKLEANNLTKNDNLFIEIKNPVIIKTGVFSRSYVQYTIISKDLSTKVDRKLSDFEWLYNRLSFLYPKRILSVLPPSHMNLKDDSDKKITYLSLYINSLISNVFIRSTPIFKDFITLSQNDFNAKKATIYDKMERPKKINDEYTLSGEFNVEISKKKDYKAMGIKDEIQQKDQLFEKLTNSINVLMAAFENMIKYYKDVGVQFKNLETAYKNDGVLDKHFSKLEEIMNKWSEGFSHQYNFFRDEIKYYFKFMQKEIKESEKLYNCFKISRDNYINQYNKAKKAVKNKNKEEDLSDKKRNEYGFNLYMLLREYDNLHKRLQVRMNKQFIKLCKEKETFTKDYTIFNELLHYDGEKNINKEKKEKVMI
jgi:hypothetical protein